MDPTVPSEADRPSPRAAAGGDAFERMAALADRAGLRRVHLLAWRDRDDPGAGGSEEHAAQVAAAWARAGLEVTLRTGRVRGAPAVTTRDGYRVVRRGGPISVIPRSALAGLLHRDGPRDGLVEIFHGFSFFAPLWARGPRIAVIHHVHLGAWHLQAAAPVAALGHVLERFVVPPLYRRTAIVAVSPSTRRELIGLGLPAAHIRVEPNGVAPRFSRGGERSPTPLVAAVGRLMPQKGFDVALRAFAEVRRRCPDARLVVVGDGPARPDLERLAAELGLGPAVAFTGRLSDDEVVGHYRRAWVLLNGSRREGWGLTLTEAAACATPAVATRIPGHTDAVVDGETGLLADGAAGLADATVALLGDPDRRERLGTNAARRAAGLRWENVAEITLQALVEDAARRG